MPTPSETPHKAALVLLKANGFMDEAPSTSPERTAYFNRRAEDVAKEYGFKIVASAKEKS